jgi:2-polyprenyl-3-methyl-5-hydroxy-6-metoxy-1,4-benzoquinol methylase
MAKKNKSPQPRVDIIPPVSAPPWDGQRETLDDLASAVNYNRWIYQILRPYIGQRILEIGCGTGNITGFLAQHGRVLATDVNHRYLESARNRLGQTKGVAFQKIDLDQPTGQHHLRQRFGTHRR